MGNMNPQSNNPLPQIKANHTIDIDRGMLNRVAEGPRKVFILPVDPVVTNSDYKINTNIDWDNIGNDLEIAAQNFLLDAWDDENNQGLWLWGSPVEDNDYYLKRTYEKIESEVEQLKNK